MSYYSWDAAGHARTGRRGIHNGSLSGLVPCDIRIRLLGENHRLRRDFFDSRSGMLRRPRRRGCRPWLRHVTPAPKSSVPKPRAQPPIDDVARIGASVANQKKACRLLSNKPRNTW